MTQIIVEVCSRTFAYPNECPCCGADPDSELGRTTFQKHFGMQRSASS